MTASWLEAVSPRRLLFYRRKHEGDGVDPREIRRVVDETECAVDRIVKAEVLPVT